MKKFWYVMALAAVIVAGLLHPAALRAQGNSSAEQEVLKVEEERLQAFQHADAAKLESIFAPEFAFVSANGEYHTLAELLSDVRTGKLKYTSLEHSDVHVRVYGDTALLTGRSGSKYIQNGKPGGAPRSYLNVYMKRDGKWRLVVRQETLMAH